MYTRVQPVLTQNTKILSKKACDTTLGKPNRSFVAFSDNILSICYVGCRRPTRASVGRRRPTK